jgi:phosphatidylserine/phosphatidylglycerophosphate/cardiolipin synthase-like enzyme
MAKFLNDTALNAALANLITNAEGFLLLVSPYIKLHGKMKDLLKVKREQGIHLVVIFGKSDGGRVVTLNLEDFEFFKSFATVEILHEERLHAKFYSSEKEAILSSMNLYDYSQNVNYEFGIHLKSGLFGGISKERLGFGDAKLDSDAHAFFYRIYQNAQRIYVKEAKKEMQGIIGFRKQVIVDTKVTVDRSHTFFSR